MTVSATDLSIDYPGNGTTVEFSVPFKVLAAGDLRVTLVNDTTEDETPQTLTTHYTIELTATGAVVTMLTAPPLGYSVRIDSDAEYTQPDTLRTQGAYSGRTVEKMFDRVTTLLNQIRRDYLSRASFITELEDYAALPADASIRSDLASSSSGKGSALVRHVASGLGAITRTLLEKLRETVSPEDFGAVGDGTDRPVSQWLTGGARDRGYANLAAIQVDFPHVTALTESIDWAAFQAAINYCESSGKPLRCSGHYQMNRGLTNDSPINLDGGGVFQAGAGTTPTYVAGARITATAAIAHILLLRSNTAGAGLYGGRVNGLLLDANNLAQKCLQADSLIRCSVSNIETMRSTVVGFDFNDGNATYFYKNTLNALYYNSTASAAAQNSDGFWFRDTNTGSNLGCVQNHIGWIGAYVVDGDGVVVGGADNNEFGAINSFVVGTGNGLVFKGPTGFVNLPPRNNFIRYLAGTLRNETASRTNTIYNASSEAASVTLTGGGTGEVKFRVFNYVTGEWWSTPDYTMKDVRPFSIGDIRNLNGTESTLNSIWPCIDLAEGVDQGVGISVGMDYDWHSGNLKAITLYLAPSTAVAGNFRVRVRGMTPADGGLTATPTLDQQFTISPSATAGAYTKHPLTFAVPLAVTKGDVILLRIDRVGTDAVNDTHTGVLKLLGGALHYTATGPTSDGGGGGPWQVLDPTI